VAEPREKLEDKVQLSLDDSQLLQLNLSVPSQGQYYISRTFGEKTRRPTTTRKLPHTPLATTLRSDRYPANTCFFVAFFELLSELESETEFSITT
jgi:hypothetical protein